MTNKPNLTIAEKINLFSLLPFIVLIISTVSWIINYNDSVYFWPTLIFHVIGLIVTTTIMSWAHDISEEARTNRYNH